MACVAALRCHGRAAFLLISGVAGLRKVADKRSAIVVTFDEDYNNITTGVGNEGNHIVTIVIP
ncbi:hypothetical protein C8E89_11310 [Mycolicibacterium moriokaense]|uniref:Uncharacterized protein n=1 Tax=Mycolicibacterium moriokaense TaxID=39691 RepID=A0A318HQ30_9MYCO|nr:hypothetical protein C8E89_11310 [Mycolicibacterium moriokaense]